LVAAALFYLLRRRTLGLTGDEEAEAPLGAKLLAEFIGTLVLVLTISLTVQAPSASPIGIVGIASSLMVMIYALGAVSGANFNPAVSVGVWLSGRLKPKELILYIVTQIAGGLAAVLIATGLLRDWTLALVGQDTPSPHDIIAQGSWGMIAGSEMIYTFVLVFVVLSVAIGPEAPNQYYGLAIGFAVLAGGVAVGKLSGGMFNPAVSIAMDFGTLIQQQYQKLDGQLGGSFIYCGFEFAGAVIAGGLFHFIHKGTLVQKDEDSVSDDGEVKLMA